MIKKTIFLFTLCLICGCSNNTYNEKTRTTQYFKSVLDDQKKSIPILNTVVSMTLYNQADDNLDTIENLLITQHKLFDPYHYYNDENQNFVINVKVINDSYGTNNKLYVDSSLIDGLSLAIELMKLSEGYFNPFIGNVSLLWKDKFSPFPIENTDPEKKEIQEALFCIPTIDNIDSIFIINKDENSILFNELPDCNGKVILDLGAFSKGYITDQVLKITSDEDITYLFNAGNSTQMFFDSLNKKNWNIGVPSPLDKSLILYTLSGTSMTSIGTSGDDRQYFLKLNEDGSHAIRSHLFNPYTGYDDSNYRSVMVITDGYNAISDVLSTALYVVEDHETQKRIIHNIETHYNIQIEVGWILEGGNDEVHLIATEGYIQRIIETSICDNLHLIHWEEQE